MALYIEINPDRSMEPVHKLLESKVYGIIKGQRLKGFVSHHKDCVYSIGGKELLVINK